MGYMLVYGVCFGCGATFGFNPHSVPSIPVTSDGTIDRSGDRQPICQTCIAFVNAKRKASGMPLWPVPADAYEPVESI